MRKICSVFVFLFFFSLTVFSQDISGRKDVVIFRTQTVTEEPAELCYAIDRTILNTFLFMKRFNVSIFNEEITNENAEMLIKEIQTYREENLQLPEDVYAGKMGFTKEDWEQLISSYFVVYSRLDKYKLKIKEELVDTDYDGEADKKRYKYFINFELTLFITNMQTGNLIGNFCFENEGSGSSLANAYRMAMFGLGEKLDFNLRHIKDFTLHSGVKDVKDDKIEIELGRNLGLNIGDEFVVIKTEVQGETFKESETALLLITNVYDDYAKGKILIEKDETVFADQVYEVPRGLAEYKLYGNINASFDLSKQAQLTGGLGLSAIFTRGFYRVRPFVSAEVAFSKEKLALGFPVRAFVGTQAGNVFIGRFQFSPEFSFGAEILMRPEKKTPDFSALILRGVLNFSYLINRDVKMSFGLGSDFSISFLNKAQSNKTLQGEVVGQFGIVLKGFGKAY